MSRLGRLGVLSVVTLGMFGVAGLGVAVWGHPPGAHESDEGVFVHIANGPNDPHRALMGLQMAALMSESKDVLVYLDVKAVELVLKDAPDVTYGQFPSSQTQLRKLLSSGTGVYVCPGCLQAAGKTPDDVMEGVHIATKEAFFDFTHGRILSLSY